MNRKVITVLSLFSSIGILLIMFIIPLERKAIFIDKNSVAMPEILILFVIVFTLMFLAYLVVTAAKDIGKNVRFYRHPVFVLLGSGISVFLLLVVKVMGDEIAREWLPEKGTVYQQSEFWLMYGALVLVFAFLTYMGMRWRK